MNGELSSQRNAYFELTCWTVAAFREGDLPVLFCSPTMELGVDIASLNVVNLRNTPHPREPSSGTGGAGYASAL